MLIENEALDRSYKIKKWTAFLRRWWWAAFLVAFLLGFLLVISHHPGEAREVIRQMLMPEPEEEYAIRSQEDTLLYFEKKTADLTDPNRYKKR